MEPILDAAQTRARERAAEARGRSVARLMEDAGAAVAMTARICASPTGRFFVFCGPGNNGGDGLVAARKLFLRGRAVHVALVGTAPRDLKGEAAANLRLLEETGLRVEAFGEELGARPGDVVVDALFGTGLKRALVGAFADAVRRVHAMRAAGATVLAVDVPSGVQSDTAAVLEPCVAADLTVTFGARKVGLVVEPGATKAGEVRVADIGLCPGAEHPVAWAIQEEDVWGWIPRREPNSHKGTFGHLLVIAGSRGKSGAAAMSAMGALRAGTGLVTVATRPDVVGEVLAHAPELMAIGLAPGEGLGMADLDGVEALLEGKQALVIGPGIPRGKETAQFLEALLSRLNVPCLLDADALNAVAERLEVLRAARSPVVLTPHPGEMARLSGKRSTEVQSDRLATARDFATAHGAILVLKGARTLVALPDGSIRVNSTGNPGMATAGTGDLLSGILGAFLAQGLDPADAASAAVFVHGRAGDLMAVERSQIGLLATDLLEGLCRVWAGWHR